MDAVTLLGLVFASGAVAGAASIVLGSWIASGVSGIRARRRVPAARKRAAL